MLWHIKTNITGIRDLNTSVMLTSSGVRKTGKTLWERTLSLNSLWILGMKSGKRAVLNQQALGILGAL